MISHPIRHNPNCSAPPAIDPDAAMAQWASQDDSGGTQQPPTGKTGKEPDMPDMPTLPAPGPYV